MSRFSRFIAMLNLLLLLSAPVVELVSLSTALVQNALIPTAQAVDPQSEASQSIDSPTFDPQAEASQSVDSSSSSSSETTPSSVNFWCGYQHYDYEKSQAYGENANPQDYSTQSSETSDQAASSAQASDSAADTAAAQAKAAEEAKKNNADSWLSQYESSIEYKADRCGQPNSTTGLIEKGDCTIDKKVITEITEVFAPTVQSDEIAGDRVLNVFSGVCCLVGVTGSDGKATTCKDVRRIYTADYKTCKDNAVDCSQRQWLIVGASGLGLVKLVVKQFYTWAAYTVGSIAVVTMVWNGFRITTSGLSGDISEYKSKITSALTAIVLLFTASLILYAVNPDFFG